MFHQLATTLLFVLASALGGVKASPVTSEGAGSIDNSAKADDLLSKAVAITGNYYLKSESGGTTLTYMHDTQPNMWPSTDPVDSLMNFLENLVDSNPGTHTGVTQKLQLLPNSDNTVRVAYPDGGKCLSSQWNFDTGVDGYAVAYECAVGPNADSTTGIREAKQWYLFVPVEDSSSSSSSGSAGITTGGSSAGASALGSSSDDSSSDDPTTTSSASSSSSTSSSTTCEKPADWVWRHPASENEDFYRVHPECLNTGVAPECTHDKAWLERHATEEWLEENPQCKATLESKKRSVPRPGKHGLKRSHRSQRRMIKQRDEDLSGKYYIIPLDHLYDMETRAVSSRPITAFAGARAAEMVLFDPSDESQIWTIEKA